MHDFILILIGVAIGFVLTIAIELFMIWLLVMSDRKI